LILEVVGPKMLQAIEEYHTMKIEIHHIPTNGLVLEYDRPAQDFSGLKSLLESGECEFVGALSVHLEVLPMRDFIRVKGRLDARIRQECGRCLATFESPLKSRFTLNYSRQIPQDVHKTGTEGIELTADQIGMVYFEGEEIDFTDAVQEQAILAVPFNPVCKPECRGLCPGCGCDLNVERCRCSGPTPDGPFAVLKDMKLKLKRGKDTEP
jgi:uncharacterized protein